MLLYSYAPHWCNVVQLLKGAGMAAFQGKRAAPRPSKTVRQSVSFPIELHETLEKLAQDKKVSVAWVVRDAVEKYVAAQWPLFGGKQ